MHSMRKTAVFLIACLLILTTALSSCSNELSEAQSTEYTYESLPQLSQAINRVFEAKNSVNNLEETAAVLMDRNMICAYLYHTMVLLNYEPYTDENGYYPVELVLFKNYEEYEAFIKGTYVKAAADILLNGSDGKNPTFTEKEGNILYNPNNTGFTVGPYFYTGYQIKNFSAEEAVCNFTYAPILNDSFTEENYNELCQSWGETFEHNCQMVLEDGQWRLSELIGAF